MSKKIYVDMCADLFHAGHVQYLKQCKQYCDDVYLIVGLHNDKTIASFKRKSICTMEERRIVLESCKYVDEVVLNAPLSVTKEYLTENNIDYVIHADGISPEEAQKMYGIAIELEIYRELPRTAGISTSDIIRRIHIQHDPWKDIWVKKGLQDGEPRVLNGHEDTPLDGHEIFKKLQQFFRPTDKILEVGCGAGYMTEFFIKNDLNYTGVDYSNTLIEKNKMFFRSNVVVAEANSLPYEDNSFDFVFVWSVFQYFDSYEYLEMVLEELERVCKRVIFIGDLRESCRKVKKDKDIIKTTSILKHLPCYRNVFSKAGYSILDPWLEDYGKRFNAIKKIIPWSETHSVIKKAVSQDLIHTILTMVERLKEHPLMDTKEGPWMYKETEIDRISRIEHFADSTWNEIFQMILKVAVGEEEWSRYYLFKDKVNYMYPGGEGFKPHQDIAAGWSTYTDYHLSIALPLVPTHEGNGCLWMAPLETAGKMLTDTIFTDLTDEHISTDKFNPVCTELGDLITFDSNIPHRSFSNQSQETRPILYLTYTFEDKYDDYHNDKWEAVPPSSLQKKGNKYRSSQSYTRCKVIGKGDLK